MLLASSPLLKKYSTHRSFYLAYESSFSRYIPFATQYYELRSSYFRGRPLKQEGIFPRVMTAIYVPRVVKLLQNLLSRIRDRI